MSVPRLVAPGATYLITRRCTQRSFLLRPDSVAREIFLYCLAYAAHKTAVEVHGFVQMSNHWHGIVRCPADGLSRFMKWINQRYGIRFDRRWGRTAHVFENRFGAAPTASTVDGVSGDTGVSGQ